MRKLHHIVSIGNSAAGALNPTSLTTSVVIKSRVSRNFSRPHSSPSLGAGGRNSNESLSCQITTCKVYMHYCSLSVGENIVFL